MKLNAVLPLFFLAGALPWLMPRPAAPDPKLALLLGRWEVVAYSEQGVQVDKKQAALPQAVAVYNHVRDLRARQWYGFGYDVYDDPSRRELRAFERWQQLDSLREVSRVAEAIAMPYFAVFFPDSTLSLYNKDEKTNHVFLPEVKQYAFAPLVMSFDLTPLGSRYPLSRVQILALSETRLTLFIPEEAEIVELEKTPFKLP